MCPTTDPSLPPTWFITVATAKRQPLFAEAAMRTLLGRSGRRVREPHPIEVDSWGLLHDHLHCIWYLAADSPGTGVRWRSATW